MCRSLALSSAKVYVQCRPPVRLRSARLAGPGGDLPGGRGSQAIVGCGRGPGIGLEHDAQGGDDGVDSEFRVIASPESGSARGGRLVGQVRIHADPAVNVRQWRRTMPARPAWG